MTISIENSGSFLQAVLGDEVGNFVISTGATKAEGLALKVIDETVDFAAQTAAKYAPLTTAVPAKSVILSIQANVEQLLVAGGTTVDFALGINDGDVDAYGLSDGLTKNTKITTLPDYAVNASAVQIDVCGVVTDGSALGSANVTAGKVRVRIAYLALSNLADA